MTRQRKWGYAAGIATAIACFALGCSKGGGTTATAPGPGGTGGTVDTVTTSFNFAFPRTGVSHRYVFAQAGDFSYLCLKHGSTGMRGTIYVRASSGQDSGVVSVSPRDNRRFSPDTLTIKPHGSVRWVNVSTADDHTVTSR